VGITGVLHLRSTYSPLKIRNQKIRK